MHDIPTCSYCGLELPTRRMVMRHEARCLVRLRRLNTTDVRTWLDWLFEMRKKADAIHARRQVQP